MEIPPTVMGIPTVLVIIYGIAFVLGIVLMPLVARIGSGSLPLLVAEPLANLEIRVGMAAIGEAVLTHTAEGKYELRYPDADTSESVPKRWERFALGRFAVGYERTRAYVGDLHWPNGADRASVLSDIAADGGTTPENSLERGGFRAFIPSVARPETKLFVLFGEAFERFKDTGGVAGLREGEREGNAEFGGDTSGYSQNATIAGMFVFLSAGIMLGWVVFF